MPKSHYAFTEHTTDRKMCNFTIMHMLTHTHPTQGFAFISEIVAYTYMERLVCVFRLCCTLRDVQHLHLPTHMVVQRHNTWSTQRNSEIILYSAPCYANKWWWSSSPEKHFTSFLACQASYTCNWFYEFYVNEKENMHCLWREQFAFWHFTHTHKWYKMMFLVTISWASFKLYNIIYVLYIRWNAHMLDFVDIYTRSCTKT